MNMLAISRRHFTQEMLDKLSPEEARKMREDRALRVMCDVVNRVRNGALTACFQRWQAVTT